MARTFTVATPLDAAFTAVLLFVITSRVISPQYTIWLVGMAAACMTLRASVMAVPAVLVLIATGITMYEFPVHFADVVNSTDLGITLLVVRNGLLVAAALIACRRLWVAYARAVPAQEETAEEESGSSEPESERLLTW
jgi:putative copper export protein